MNKLVEGESYESKTGINFKVLSINESAKETKILTEKGFELTMDLDDVERSINDGE